MPTSPSIPILPSPGKDPPPSKPSTSPQITSPTPPTPTSQPATSPPQIKASRPSPLRQTTSSSLLPTHSALYRTSTGTSTLQPADLEVQEGAEVPPRPPLTPFFTLIHDPSTNTTHHPSRIHYLFSDDDDTSDLLSPACIRSLHPPAAPPSRTSSPQGKSTSPPAQAANAPSSSSSFSSSALRRSGREKDKEKEKEKAEEREERVIIIDINTSGRGIVSASSLSANWQILSASLSSAPTFDGPASPDQDEDAAAGERGLMLRVEGVSVDTSDAGDGLGIEKRGSGVLGDDDDMQALLEGFDKKMAVLRKIVGEGWGGGAVDAGAGEEKGDDG